ncbi:MAG: heavy-metal-associated domain-containing protein [Waddliaceae bacterium]
MTSHEYANAVLKIGGMSCSHCNLSVEGAFKKIDGVVDARADYNEGKAEIRYEEEKVGIEEIINAFNKHGHYKASLSLREP